jgi:hypothetical protein
MALMFSGVGGSVVKSSGQDRIITTPTGTGKLVATAAAALVPGTVAVCAPVPIETKAMFGPSFRKKIESPDDARGWLALAVAVTEMARTSALAGKRF